MQPQQSLVIFTLSFHNEPLLANFGSTPEHICNNLVQLITGCSIACGKYRASQSKEAYEDARRLVLESSILFQHLPSNPPLEQFAKFAFDRFCLSMKTSSSSDLSTTQECWSWFFAHHTQLVKLWCFFLQKETRQSIKHPTPEMILGRKTLHLLLLQKGYPRTLEEANARKQEVEILKKYIDSLRQQQLV